ncbi:hypothetical protein BuS5_02197 [Desulfosarcina sp. BuS5]|nr:hypothetical protein BuS5_02197 [Desulfosarcina sp. BuS5]
MSLLFVDQDILILHLKQLSSFWGVLYVYLRFVRSSLSSPDTLYRPSFNVCVSANGRLVARRDIPMQRRDFACAGFPVTVLFTQGNIRVSQVPELPL